MVNKTAQCCLKKKKDSFKIRKRVLQDCHPAYLTYMQSTSCEIARLVEAQAGIMIAGRIINNLRYADDTTIMIRREEKLKSLLMEVKRRVKKLA